MKEYFELNRCSNCGTWFSEREEYEKCPHCESANENFETLYVNEDDVEEMLNENELLKNQLKDLREEFEDFKEHTESLYESILENISKEIDISKIENSGRKNYIAMKDAVELAVNELEKLEKSENEKLKDRVKTLEIRCELYKERHKEILEELGNENK